ncbi:hypothetical protein [Roseovarius dicentrarchi]|uniref:hypothetical protein n=1 Tax=Roseovarius dicentrarchi TaxID=2250573 RepID=UPI000DEA7873|nr:hypothetical protein [Roseovarius dicentrarchi]
MKNDWILDVLDDLRAFALHHHLPALSEQLDDARLIAASELAAQGEGIAAHDRTRAIAIGCDTGKVADGP